MTTRTERPSVRKNLCLFLTCPRPTIPPPRRAGSTIGGRIRLLQTGDRRPGCRAVRDQHPAPQPHWPSCTWAMRCSSREDLMIRYKRMRGYAALWVPGYDHAGIATQLQVEKMLAREGIAVKTWAARNSFAHLEWKEKYGDHIVRQLRRLGASCDWDACASRSTRGSAALCARRLFASTAWPDLSRRVSRELVTRLQTAVSDLEVEYSEKTPSCTPSSTPSPAPIWPMAGQRLHPGGDGAA